LAVKKEKGQRSGPAKKKGVRKNSDRPALIFPRNGKREEKKKGKRWLSISPWRGRKEERGKAKALMNWGARKRRGPEGMTVKRLWGPCY